MAVRVVRLGTPRAQGEGIRLGTVRRPPRGVRKQDYARRDYYDLWLPDVAPSAGLVSFAFAKPFTPARWATYARRYRREMKAPAAERLLALLAAFSHHADFAVGCYCEDESHCHRSLLRALLRERGAAMTQEVR
jgi:uncharacterized protein YeaO (DUF488 family)